MRPTFVRPEVRHDSDAAVIPGGLTPLIQTLFGKILPHPNFAVAITNSLTQYCNRSRGYQCRIYGGGISLWSWGSVGILQKLNCFSCQLRWGGGGRRRLRWTKWMGNYKVTIFPRDADSPGSITGPWYNIVCQQCWTMPVLGELNCLVGKCNIIKKHCKIPVVDLPRRYSILLCFGVRIQPADADGRWQYWLNKLLLRNRILPLSFEDYWPIKV